MGSAVDSGVGFYSMSWVTSGRDDKHLGDATFEWCRATLAKMHRPYGVDGVSLALLVHGRGRRPVASVRFALLHPSDFYGTCSAEANARDVLQSWHGAGILGRRGTRLTALLFSWGDFTQQLVQAG